MRYSVGLPTGMEGLTYPVPFATKEQIIEIAVACERMGYDSVWGNDHMTTQKYVRDDYAKPPNYWEILTTYAFVLAATTKLRVGTSMLVLPMRRDIVVVAKQLATLDQFSNGRVEVGLGIGAYREEFNALNPKLKGANRGEMVGEGIQALRKLFYENRSTFEGKYYQFDDVEMYPKPHQKTLPLLIGGNSKNGMVRAATHADGWIPACIGPEDFAERVKFVRQTAADAGRDPLSLDLAPQLACYVGRTREQAVERFGRSQMRKHLDTLIDSTLKDYGSQNHIGSNIVGSVEDCIAQTQRYKDAGATHILGLYFAADTVEEMLEQAQIYAEEVIPHIT